MYGKFNDFWAKLCLLNASVVLTIHQTDLKTSSKIPTTNMKSKSPTVPVFVTHNSKTPAAMKHQQLELLALVIIWLKTKLGKLWRTDFEIFHCTRLNALGYDCWFLPCAKRQPSSQDTHSRPTFCRHCSAKSSLLLLVGLIPNAKSVPWFMHPSSWS